MEHVLNKTLKLREAAAIFGITKSTLGYRIKLFKNNQKSKGEDFSSKYSVNQVFTRFDEDMLEKYILKSSKMNYGLTYQQTRLLAYQYAKILKNCPGVWQTNQIAGIEWLKSFMQRHRSLSLRKPQVYRGQQASIGTMSLNSKIIMREHCKRQYFYQIVFTT